MSRTPYYSELKTLTYAALENPQSPAWPWVNGFIFALVLLSLVLIPFENYESHSIFVSAVEDIWHPKGHLVNFIIDCITLIFAVEYVLRLWVNGSTLNQRVRYIFKPMSLIDFIAILPIFRFVRVARLLRFLRLVRILRVLKIARFIRGTEIRLGIKGLILRRIGYDIGIAALFVSAVVYTGFVGLHMLEAGGTAFQDPWEALWWSVLSVLGASDTSRLETQMWLVKLIGVTVLFGGLVSFGVFTGSVTALFDEKIRLAREGKHKINHTGHTVICGWDSRVKDIFEHLVDRGLTDVVLLASLTEDPGITHKPSVEGSTKKNRVFATHKLEFVSGNATSKEDLRRANVHLAGNVIVIADRSFSASSDDMDSKSIVTVMAIEELVQETVMDRQQHLLKPLHVLVEILSSQKKRMLFRVVNDCPDIVLEVISEVEYLSALVGQSSQIRGVAEVYAKLLVPGSSDIFCMKIPPCLQNAQRTFDEVHSFLRDRNLLLLGVFRNYELEGSSAFAELANIQINPPKNSRLELTSKDRLIVVAQDYAALKKAEENMNG